jgi:type II secretory ATPase GspE/PulE/Tfp pilus assembly ATPase PilB-like protein
MPGIHGEAVVIRLQSRGITKLGLETLGFEGNEVEKIGRLISRPHGLFLVTGPTGSGKTTTLYACLNRIVSPDVKIITIEDPVEYWMDNILQMQVHQEIEFTFARALRHMLRHDPDVMLVGEIRDLETAEIAIRSSLTGHLVFATLHANSAMGAPTRLVDIGVEPYLVANAVHGVLAQRLVRNTCPSCKREVSVDTLAPYERAVLEDAGLLGKIPLWRGAGCEQCRFMGYRGRTAIGEVLEVSAAIRQLIQRGESAESIQQQAKRDGMRTLRESGLRKIEAGITTVSEVLRVTQDDI